MNYDLCKVITVLSLSLSTMLLITRVIHLTSGLSQQWRDAVLNPDLTVEALTQIMDQFVA